MKTLKSKLQPFEEEEQHPTASRKFEYTTGLFKNLSHDEMLKSFNNMGEYGWELVSFNENAKDMYFAFFKREI